MTNDTLHPRLGFVPLARPTFDVPLAEAVTASARQQLTAAGYDLHGPETLVLSADDVEAAITALREAAVDLLVVFQASFADSTMTQRLAEAIDAPLLLWAVPEAREGGRLRLNSFCGINLAGHALKRAGIRYTYLYAEPDDQAALQQVDALARAAVIRRRLQGAKIGRIGENPAGFETCLFDGARLAEQIGVEVMQVELAQVFEQARQVEPAAVAAVGEQVRARVDGVDALDETATRGTLSSYVTMRDIAAEHDLQGLAVRCWPEFFSDLGCSACGAMSMMSDNMQPCSCEADVNGTITQLILQWFSGEPAFGSDLVAFDTENDTAVLWHCGLAPLHMADPDVRPEATIHSNRQMPLLMQFPLKPGRVTVARLSEATGDYRLVIGAGEMLKAPPAFTGTTGTLRFDSGAQSVMDTIMNEGLEHHLSLTYGDHIAGLLALANLLHLPVLRL